MIYEQYVSLVLGSLNFVFKTELLLLYLRLVQYILAFTVLVLGLQVYANVTSLVWKNFFHGYSIAIKFCLMGSIYLYFLNFQHIEIMSILCLTFVFKVYRIHPRLTTELC